MNLVVNKSFRWAARWERRMCYLVKAAEVQYVLRPKK
jgi:hypothetical protein